jgi:hypothetical protein
VNLCFERLARPAGNLLRIQIDGDDVVGGENVAGDVARTDDDSIGPGHAGADMTG